MNQNKIGKFGGELLLLVSTLGALGLFFIPSTIVTLILIGIFGVLVLERLICRNTPLQKLTVRPGALLLAVSFALIGLLLFPDAMGKTAALAHLGEKLHLSGMTLAWILAGVLCLVGFYAFYRLAYWMENLVCRGLGLSEEARPVLGNLLFPVSGAAFFLLEAVWSLDAACAAVASVALALVIAMHSPSLLTWSQEKPRSLRILALLTALGILLFRMHGADSGIFGMAAAVLALPFVALCLIWFYSWLRDTFLELGTFRDVSKGEWVLYGGMLLVCVLLVTAVFLKSDAFYGTAHPFDVIYTSDSPELVGQNAYLDLRHHQNDLRQPLFAVFAAPFLGIPYLLSRLTGVSLGGYARIMDYAQIALLLFTNFLLAKMLDLSAKKRMLFMGLTLLSYPVLLFLLMMEQYIVAYFYLILTMYLLSQRSRRSTTAIWGTGGTLLTGMILLPTLAQHRIFREWCREMLDRAMEFVTVLLLFGRLDILLNAATQLLSMTQFTGKALTLGDKLGQYTGFFRACLLAPDGGPDLTTMGFASWQLRPAEGICILGAAVLALCALSVYLNRKDRASLLAGGWMVFSFLVLCLLGWGTQENGLILYALYFGWPVWLLLFRLGQRVEDKIPHAGTILGILGMIVLAAVNLPAMLELIQFACAYYPI